MSGNGDGTLRTPRVAIIGAGMSGIGMACRLRMAGIESFHLYEKHAAVGGTWWANRYPGLHCDVPSRNYQYTFAPNPDWTHLFSPGVEIWNYIDRVADEFDLKPRISFETPVAEAAWRDGAWTVTTAAGEVAEYDFLVCATGVLVQPRKPDIPGLETFAGRAFHSAEWDEDAVIDGARVAVVGTGSTGVQLVKGIAGRAGHLELYQRTPQWIAPLPNRRYTRPTKWALRRVPALERLAYAFWGRLTEGIFGVAVVEEGWQRRYITWLCRRHLESIDDPELRRRFTPPDLPMCKRLIGASDFYELFARPDVDLVDIGIDHVEPRGIVTTDGTLHEQDVIVLATGFNAHNYMLPMELIGLGGKRLSQEWGAREPYGYRTVALPGFPNAFTLIGPHSPFGNQSLFTISETQVGFVMRWIERWRARQLQWVMPTDEATEQFNATMRAEFPHTIWSSGCNSWYLGRDGLPFAWPWLARRHREMLREPVDADWLVEV